MCEEKVVNRTDSYQIISKGGFPGFPTVIGEYGLLKEARFVLGVRLGAGQKVTLRRERTVITHVELPAEA